MKNEHETHCLVAELAQEARTVIDAQYWVDEQRFCHKAERFRFEWQEKCLFERLQTIKTAGAAFQAKSSIGAMFQIHLIDDLVSLIEAEVPEKSDRRRDCEELRKAITQICYSVRDHIAATSGEDPDTACADYFMPKEQSPHGHIADAVAKRLPEMEKADEPA